MNWPWGLDPERDRELYQLLQQSHGRPLDLRTFQGAGAHPNAPGVGADTSHSTSVGNRQQAAVRGPLLTNLVEQQQLQVSRAAQLPSNVNPGLPLLNLASVADVQRRLRSDDMLRNAVLEQQRAQMAAAPISLQEQTLAQLRAQANLRDAILRQQQQLMPATLAQVVHAPNVASLPRSGIYLAPPINLPPAGQQFRRPSLPPGATALAESKPQAVAETKRDSQEREPRAYAEEILTIPSKKAEASQISLAAVKDVLGSRTFPSEDGPFPQRLYHILTEVEKLGKTDIISFNEKGDCFRIHRPKAFMAEIAPRYFRHKKIASLKRQLNMYGFEKVAAGPDKGSFFHKYFQKGKPELLYQIQRDTKAKAGLKRPPGEVEDT